MKGTLEKAFGYQGDQMNLPVSDVEAAIPFYVDVLGFHVASRDASPHASVTLGRDAVQMRLVENGGDPSQDGCAFHVTGVEALRAAFQERGMRKEGGEFGIERRNDGAWKVFYVVAPDGLCYWFGERQAGS